MRELDKILGEIEKQEKRCLNGEYEPAYGAGALDMANAIKDIIRSLSRENKSEITRCPRDNDGWIPVEERLPEGRTRVICQLDNGDIELLWQDWESDPESLTYWTDFDFMAEKKVIAWHPLPEPYHPERSEGE